MLVSLIFASLGTSMATSNKMTGDALWAFVEGSTWFDTGAFAGGTVEFYRDGSGVRRAKHILFGSGVPEIGRSEGAVSIEGSVVEIHWDLKKGSAPSAEPAYVYDERAGVFLTDSCKDRLIPYETSKKRLPVPFYRTLSEKGRSAVLKAFNSPEEWTVREAIYAWTDLWWKDPQSENFRDVVRFLDDPRPDVRVYAIWSCGTMNLKDASPKIMQALSDKDVRVRREAALALRPGIAFGHEKAAMESLAKTAAKDPDPSVRQAAKLNLERF